METRVTTAPAALWAQVVKVPVLHGSYRTLNICALGDTEGPDLFTCSPVHLYNYGIVCC